MGLLTSAQKRGFAKKKLGQHPMKLVLSKRRDQIDADSSRGGKEKRAYIKDHEKAMEESFMEQMQEQQDERDANADAGIRTFHNPNLIEYGKRYNTPFVKTRTEPLPLYEAPHPILVWNQSKGIYQLREDKIQSEKTKQVILSMHRRHPKLYSMQNLSKLLGISIQHMLDIFWEDELGRKHKLWPDYDNVKRHELYHGTDQLVESRAYTFDAYNEVTGDSGFRPEGGWTPQIVPEDGVVPDTVYHSWRVKQRLPKLEKDQWEVVPDAGPGSGRKIPLPKTAPQKSAYMITDFRNKLQKTWQPKQRFPVKVRERDGTLRHGTLEEFNWVRRREMPLEKSFRLKAITPPFGAGTLDNVDGRLKGKQFTGKWARRPNTPNAHW